VPLQAERLQWLLEVIGWSRGELARRLDIADSFAAQMCEGKRKIPNRAAVWLETLAAIHLSMPKPRSGANRTTRLGAAAMLAGKARRSTSSRPRGIRSGRVSLFRRKRSCERSASHLGLSRPAAGPGARRTRHVARRQLDGTLTGAISEIKAMRTSK
jgi:hypothetical protein